MQWGERERERERERDTTRNWNQPLQIIVTNSAAAESGIIITYNTSEEEAIYQARSIYPRLLLRCPCGKIYTHRAAAAAASSPITRAGILCMQVLTGGPQ
uniref:Uncharacterized protein n=1 Tax=Trichogramma kaykai TaxID=54128 RepID=A0ABD2VVX4_9HYME